MSDTICGFVQYNNDNNGYFPYGMDKMCELLTTGPIDQAFPLFYHDWNSFSGNTCSDSSYDAALANLKNVDPKSPGAAGRSWYYQTCTEFGYYQTGESSNSPFSPKISLDYFLGMCEAAFGLSKDDVQFNVNWTNELYGARNISSSRIMFTNGLVDPWHALGITKIPSSELPTQLMPGTAHCADLYPSRAEDLPILTATRLLWIEYLTRWLDQE